MLHVLCLLDIIYNMHTPALFVMGLQVYLRIYVHHSHYVVLSGQTVLYAPLHTIIHLPDVLWCVECVSLHSTD